MRFRFIVSKILNNMSWLYWLSAVYTPPNAALRGCHIYDVESGDAKHVIQGAYDSVRGVVPSLDWWDIIGCIVGRFGSAFKRCSGIPLIDTDIMWRKIRQLIWVQSFEHIRRFRRRDRKIAAAHRARRLDTHCYQMKSISAHVSQRSRRHAIIFGQLFRPFPNQHRFHSEFSSSYGHTLLPYSMLQILHTSQISCQISWGNRVKRIVTWVLVQMKPPAWMRTNSTPHLDDGAGWTSNFLHNKPPCRTEERKDHIFMVEVTCGGIFDCFRA